MCIYHQKIYNGMIEKRDMVNLILGTIVIAVGLVGAIWPYKVAWFKDLIDAIGSKRSGSKVELADWKVLLTRIFGIGVSLYGVLVLFDI